MSGQYYNFDPGEMAEWSNAAVLKTVDCYRSGGSNPSLSAGIQNSPSARGYFHFKIVRKCLISKCLQRCQ